MAPVAELASRKKRQTSQHRSPQSRAGDAGDCATAFAPRRRRFGQTLDRARPLTKPDLQKMSEDLLRGMELGEQYLGFAMVCIANEFWREQVQAIDFSAPSAAAAALPQERRGLSRRLRRVRPRLPQVRRLLRRRLQDQGRGSRLQGAGLRRHAHRPQDHRQRPCRCHRRRGLPECAGKGHRQDSAGRHSLRGRAAAVEQLQKHVGR